MELRQVEGRDMQEALERTRDELGADAVVVSHSRTADGRVTLVVSDEVPRSMPAIQALRAQARAVLARPAEAKVRPRTVSVSDVERRMRMSGCSQEFVAHVSGATKASGLVDQHPLDVAAQIIGREFEVAKARRQSDVTPVMTFVGPHGVGKTTSIVKLARSLALARRKIALTALDVGVVSETLQRYADVVGLPFADRTLLGQRAGTQELDTVLLDTSGNVNTDVPRLVELGRRLAARGTGWKLETYLMLSASSNTAALEELVRSAAPLDPVGCIITKLDEAPLRAPILEFARSVRLPVAFFSDGASHRGRLHRASADRFADLCLGGRLS